MISFAKRQVTTRTGRMRIVLSALVLLVLVSIVTMGMTFIPQVEDRYAVYATGEKVVDPWVVNVDGKPIAVVESEEAGKVVETGLRMEYCKTFNEQQAAVIENEITVTKYTFKEDEHPVVMTGPEAVAYIAELNKTQATPVVAVVTEEMVTDTEAIPFEKEEKKDNTIKKGETKVETKGVEGSKQVTKNVTMVSGKATNYTVLSEKVTKEPVTEVVLVGTKVEKPANTVRASNSSNSGGSGGNAISGGGLATAYDMIGTPYVYGGMSANGVDCSGLVNYCYGGARGRTTYSMISSLQSTGDWKTSMSDLEVGDLIFTDAGHVGIYVGGGEMIHSPMPGQTVRQQSVYRFYGGGKY